MKSIDIERLLQWAFRDELPKRRRPIAARAESNIWSYCDLGTRIDRSHYDRDPVGFSPGEPHPEAVIVENAVVSLSQRYYFCADSNPADDDRTKLERDLALIRTLLPEAPLLAHLGYDEVIKTPFNLVAIVHSKARQAVRPSYHLGPMVPCKVLGGNGQPILVGQCYGKGRYSEGAHNLLEYKPSPAQVMSARAHYAVWHAALARLVAMLAGKLKEHRVTGPAAPAEPWVTGEPPKARILQSLPSAKVVPAARSRKSQMGALARLNAAIRRAA
jgi:hypothetical protein